MSHLPPAPTRSPLSRRAALGVLGTSLAGVASAALPRWARALGRDAAHDGSLEAEHGHCGGGGAHTAGVVHPTPRDGITASAILPEEQVPERSREAYAKARQIPEILDGIYCHCDCAKRHDLRSLLQCFESDMAARCGICTGQARLAHRLHRQGKSLDEIRAAIDERYGD